MIRSEQVTTEEIRDFIPYIDSRLDPSAYPGGAGAFVIERLSRGPVPLMTIIELARRTAFGGLELIEKGIGSAFDGAGGDSSGFPDAGPPRADASSTVDDAFERIFEALGERRMPQLEMARKVQAALADGKIALIEAGTGTGKSLAYLVPAALHAIFDGKRSVISTHTKNLQDQLYNVEVPRLRSIAGLDPHVERLMGRENYLCPKRLVSLIASTAADDPCYALDIALAAAFSQDGTADSISSFTDPAQRRSIRAPSRCRMATCPHQESCPLVIARRRARKASILLVNHALVTTDFAQDGSVIGPYDSIVFDEAHRLEKCVVENLSVRIARGDIERILEKVSPVGLSDDRWKYLADRLSGARPSTDWRAMVRDLSDSIADLESAASGFFNAVTRSLDPGKRLRSTRTRYTDGPSVFVDVAEEKNAYIIYINNIREKLNVMLDVLPKGSEGLGDELEYVCDDLLTLEESIGYLTDASDEESVFWIEWSAGGSAAALCGSPLDVGRRFADYLGERALSAVFTSATLSTGDSFGFIKERLGIGILDSDPVEMIADHAFDYGQSCSIIVQRGSEEPRDAGFERMTAETVEGLIKASGRKVMVLFTSYRSCSEVGSILGGMEIQGGVLVQGESGSREQISREFREGPSAALLGVASFWEGVDFPGEQLEILVIPKLPFPVPTEPVIEARSERMKKMGEDPFTRLHLPEAVLRLKQGVGRLIRRSGDRGVVVLLDPRIDTRPYGMAFLSALPVKALRTASAGETVEIVREWFGDSGRH